MAKRVCIGVDVGGTNTDAVVLHRHSVLSSAKEFTTRDVTKGVARAIQAAVSRAERKGSWTAMNYSIIAHYMYC